MKYPVYHLLWIVILAACSREAAPVPPPDRSLVLEDNGRIIRFRDPKQVEVFKTEPVSAEEVTAAITAPAKVSATVIPSGEGASQPIVLFENPDLAGNYTLLIQHQINISQIEHINIRQRQVELDRARDLQQHGAASGKDLLDAQTALAMEKTNLANERAALIEHETKLKAAGFNPETLRKAIPGTAYITCDIPEGQVNKIREGSACSIQFTSFPEENFSGLIDDIADVVDNSTRMVKLRITLKNPGHRLKAGMFALVTFGVAEGHHLHVPRTALITVQGKNYVFVQTADMVYERREVMVGPQIHDNILLYHGVQTTDRVVVRGAIQLKGISFGY